MSIAQDIFSQSPYPTGKEVNVKINDDWQKRQSRQTALEAALKMSTTAEPEARLIQRATVIYNFLYGEDK